MFKFATTIVPSTLLHSYPSHPSQWLQSQWITHLLSWIVCFGTSSPPIIHSHDHTEGLAIINSCSNSKILKKTTQSQSSSLRGIPPFPCLLYYPQMQYSFTSLSSSTHYFLLPITFAFIFLLTLNNHHCHSITWTLNSSLLLLFLPSKTSTPVELNCSTFACLHQSRLFRKGRGGRAVVVWESDNKTSWFHLKFTTLNLKRYLTLPARITIFRRKSSFSISKWTSLYDFSLFKLVTPIFLYITPSVEHLLRSIREKFPHFPTKATLLPSY